MAGAAAAADAERARESYPPVTNHVCVIPHCFRAGEVILENFVLPELLPKIKEMPTCSDDTYIISYPRTGTTWTEKILACLLEGVEAGDKIDVEARFPFIEFTQPPSPDDDLPAYCGLNLANGQSRPRFLKSHMPPGLLPSFAEGSKIILIMRDPADTLVSHYHFYRNMSWIKYKGSLDAMFNAYISDEHIYGGYFFWYREWGQFLANQSNLNVHFLNYERMKADASGEIKRLAEFIGRPVSDEEAEKVREASDFKRMKETVDIPGIPNFIRAGKVGEGRAILSPTQLAAIKARMAHIKKLVSPQLPIDGYL